MIAKPVKIAMLAAMALGFSSCASGGKATNEVGEGKEAQKEPIELVFFLQSSGWSEEMFMKQFGDSIKLKFPYITPKFIPLGKGTSLDELITAGQVIDVWLGSVNAIIPNPLKLGLTTDISELVQKHGYNLNQLEPTTVEQMRSLADGKLFGLPYGTSTTLILYNKSLFDKFGVGYPKDGMTWDELYQTAVKLTRFENGTQYRGFSMTVGHMLLLNQLSAGFVDPKTEKPTLVADSWKRVADNFARFYTIPGNDVTDKTVQLAEQQNGFFKRKDTAMYAGLSGLPADLESMNWDAVQLPEYKDAPGIGSQSYPSYALVTKQSKHTDDAFRVIAYLASEEMQARLARLGTSVPIITKPEIISQFGQDMPMLQGKNINAFFPKKLASAPAKTKFDSVVQPKLYEDMYKYLSGMKDVNTALRDAESAGQKAIDDEKAKSK
ncbi:MAG: extracellular solute-binding protein family 1 [Paenibacillus sp.]|jgi:multiple sugar transport system substrate-binding protein|nr:extracellular solute-binding protein family 1 [Paenibacillus sp.]